MSAPAICPVCKVRSLREHSLPGCSWMKCDAPECRATVDLDHRIAFRMKGDEGAKVVEQLDEKFMRHGGHSQPHGHRG